MPLTVAGTPEQRGKVEALLKKICPTAAVQKGTPLTGNVTIGRGPFAMDDIGCCCLRGLILSGNTTFIRLLAKPTEIVPKTANLTIAKAGGGATRAPSTGKKRQGPGGKLVNGPGGGATVYLDISDNNGDGYFVWNDDPNDPDPLGGRKRIDDPLHVILFHELCTGHATESLRGEFVKDEESVALACENRFRAELGLSRRDGGGGGANPAGGSRPPK